MGLVVSTGYLKTFLQAIKFRVSSPNNPYWVSLFVNNLTPTPDTLLAEFTEASFPGYQKQVVSAWGLAYGKPGPLAEIDNQPLYWVVPGVAPTPPQTVYGYFMWDQYQFVAWSERFPAPLSVWAPEQRIALILSLQLGELV